MLLPDLQAQEVEWLGLCVTAGDAVVIREVVQAVGELGVVAPQLRLADLQAAAVEWLGFGVSCQGVV